LELSMLDCRFYREQHWAPHVPRPALAVSTPHILSEKQQIINIPYEKYNFTEM